MKILALDTSTDFLSLAAIEDGCVVGETHEEAGTRHSEILVPGIKDMLKKINWDIRDIGLVATGIGPGSFTGLRIGVSVVKGIALALGTPVMGLPTMDAIAMRGPSGKGQVVPILDAHKGKVYTCVYEKTSDGELLKKTGYLLCDIKTLREYTDGKVVLFGNGLKKYKHELEMWPMAEINEKLDWYPRATDIGKKAFKLFPGSVIDPVSLEPMYLYPRDCNILRK